MVLVIAWLKVLINMLSELRRLDSKDIYSITCALARTNSKQSLSMQVLCRRQVSSFRSTSTLVA